MSGCIVRLQAQGRLIFPDGLGETIKVRQSQPEIIMRLCPLGLQADRFLIVTQRFGRSPS